MKHLERVLKLKVTILKWKLDKSEQFEIIYLIENRKEGYTFPALKYLRKWSIRLCIFLDLLNDKDKKVSTIDDMK